MTPQESEAAAADLDPAANAALGARLQGLVDAADLDGLVKFSREMAEMLMLSAMALLAYAIVDLARFPAGKRGRGVPKQEVKKRLTTVKVLMHELAAMDGSVELIGEAAKLVMEAEK